jgi:hypothetical protein
MTDTEKSLNDSYLIVNAKEKITKISYRISYRANLIKELKNLYQTDNNELSSLNVNDINDFRKLVLIAEKNGYEIYQLTRL